MAGEGEREIPTHAVHAAHAASFNSSAESDEAEIV